MADHFDPYHKWLGIPPDEQPPHHYRLLAIRLFESDSEVIEAAADQRMAHVRNYQTGMYAAESQQILNELAAAKRTLLVPGRRAAYDVDLQAALARTPRRAGAAQPPSLPTRGNAIAEPDDNSPVPLPFTEAMRAPLSERWQPYREPGSLLGTLVSLLVIVIAGIAIGAFVLIAIPRKPVVTETAQVDAQVDETAAEVNEEDGDLPPVTPLPADPQPITPKKPFNWGLKSPLTERPTLPTLPINPQPATPATTPAKPPLDPAPEPKPPSTPLPVKPEAPPTQPVVKPDPNPLPIRIREAMKNRTLERTIEGGAPASGTAFIDVPLAGAILVGLRYTVVDGQRISSLQPIFVSATGGGNSGGKTWGTPRGTPGSIVAKRGYAVSGIRVQGETSITGLELLFMRLDRTGLTHDDSYTSPWIGPRDSKPEITLGNDGMPVVGIFGHSSATVFSLGLVQLPPE